MEVKEQRYVCTLAETGNLTKAADQLFISQPALSIYISNLEKRLGTSLFERQGKKFVLNQAGERYVVHARKILTEAKEFDGELTNLLSDQSGRLRMGIPLLRGPWLMPEVLIEFRKKWPEVNLTLREGNIAFLNDLLEAHELDMILINEENKNPRMDCQKLFDEEFLVAVPAGHPLNGKAKFTKGQPYGLLEPEDLDGQVFLGTTEQQSSRALLDEILKKYHIQPSRVVTIRGIELNLQLVAEGVGITLVREGFTKFLRYSKPVNLYQLDIPEHRRAVVLAYHHRDQVPDYMLDMAELLKKRAQEIMHGRL
ncbi:LysR family transcriptional regulator [Acidaminococcus timonensis]|uniref:LysR family transcriptional regulator n=1 Tax=Acidaminococcus timonensis TaxID=1871002 RepID=UPI0026EFC0DA|nr:LysR family transcriptional regulator [Acidaminococcus timonensis]